MIYYTLFSADMVVYRLKTVSFGSIGSIEHDRIDTPESQEILGIAYAARAVPTCACGQPVSIRVIADAGDEARFILARLPRSFPLHDPMCSFRRTPDKTGLAGVVRDTGDFLEIAIDTRLSVTPPGMPKPPPQEKSEPGQKGEKRAGDKDKAPQVALTGLLRYLWVSAGLNRSPFRRPAWSEVKLALDEALEPVRSKGKSLAGITYVPPPYIKEESDSAKASWNTYLAKAVLTAGTKSAPCGILIAEVKSLEPWGTSGNVFALKVKHMPFQTFSVFTEVRDQLLDAYPDLERLGTPDLRLILVATIYRNAKGFLAFDKVGMMSTNADLLPILHPRAPDAFAKLRGEGVRFSVSAPPIPMPGAHHLELEDGTKIRLDSSDDGENVSDSEENWKFNEEDLQAAS